MGLCDDDVLQADVRRPRARLALAALPPVATPARRLPWALAAVRARHRPQAEPGPAERLGG
jgi:hypothetical protein